MMDRFAGDSVVYGAATVLSRACLLVALLVLPFILTPRDYGALGMIVTVTALVAILAPLEISQAVARFYAPAKEVEKRALAGTAWAFLLLMTAMLLLVGQVMAGPLCRLVLGDLSFLPVFRIALLLMTFNALFLFLQAQCRWEFRTAEYVLISLVFAFLGLALSIGLGLLLQPPLFGVVLGQALGAGVAAALGAAGLKQSLRLRLDTGWLRDLLRFSLPLVPASLALFLSVHAGRIVLNAFSTLEDVGLYTLATQIAGIAALGIVGVQGALTPLVMASHQKPETPAQLARLFEGFFASAVVVCLLLGLFAPELVWIIGYPGYERAGPLVLLLAPGLLLTQMYVFAPGFAVAHRSATQMWVSVASAIIAVGANLALVSTLGLAGAALATLLAGIAFLALWFVFSQPLYPIPVRWGAIAAASAVGIVAGAIGSNIGFSGLAVALAVKAALCAAAAAFVVLSGMVPLRSTLAALRAVPLAQRRR